MKTTTDGQTIEATVAPATTETTTVAQPAPKTAKTKKVTKPVKKVAPSTKLAGTAKPVTKAKKTEPAKGNVIAKPYRDQYGKLGNCGDAFAKAMIDYLEPKGVELEDKRTALIVLGDANDVDVDARWPGKNTGMIRMNLGNVLRARIGGPLKVVIPGVRTWEAVKVEAKAKASPATPKAKSTK